MMAQSPKMRDRHLADGSWEQLACWLSNHFVLLSKRFSQVALCKPQYSLHYSSTHRTTHEQPQKTLTGGFSYSWPGPLSMLFIGRLMSFSIVKLPTSVVLWIRKGEHEGPLPSVRYLEQNEASLKGFFEFVQTKAQREIFQHTVFPIKSPTNTCPKSSKTTCPFSVYFELMVRSG